MKYLIKIILLFLLFFTLFLLSFSLFISITPHFVWLSLLFLRPRYLRYPLPLFLSLFFSLGFSVYINLFLSFLIFIPQGNWVCVKSTKRRIQNHYHDIIGTNSFLVILASVQAQQMLQMLIFKAERCHQINTTLFIRS